MLSQNTSSSDSSQTQTPIYDVLISGMGPAGLTAAIELINSGKSVVIITNRSQQFLRVQGISLSEEKRKYLADMISTIDKSIMTENDKKFLISLNQDITISLKEIEKFLYRQLLRHQTEGKSISLIFESELKQIDLKKGEATFGRIHADGQSTNHDLKSLFFTHLICADGKNRHALSLVEKNTGKLINFTPDPNSSAHHVYHANVYVCAKRKDNKPFILPKLDFNSVVQEGLLSFTSLNRRHLRKHENEGTTTIKFIYATEVPLYFRDNSNEIERKKYILEKAKETIVAMLPPENGDIEISVAAPSKKYGLAKDKLKLTFFESHLEEADQVIIQDLNLWNATVILSGDNCRTSNYQLGHGVLDAFSHAVSIGKLLNKEIDPDNYTGMVKALNQKNSMRSQLFDAKKDVAAQALNEKAERVAKSFPSMLKQSSS